MLREELGLSLAGQVWRHWHPGNLGERYRGAQKPLDGQTVWFSLSLWASPVFSRQRA